MGIFKDILHKIFPSTHPAVTAPETTPADVSAAANAASEAASASAAASAASAAAANMPPVDVGAVLAGLAAKNPQKLNYQTSIVDLMKLLDLDSSLTARKELAKELGYSGDMNDSATMNIWLHKQVILKLEQNGGQVPAELKH
jgi:hypothetical protein